VWWWWETAECNYPLTIVSLKIDLGLLLRELWEGEPGGDKVMSGARTTETEIKRTRDNVMKIKIDIELVLGCLRSVLSSLNTCSSNWTGSETTSVFEPSCPQVHY